MLHCTVQQKMMLYIYFYTKFKQVFKLRNNDFKVKHFFASCEAHLFMTHMAGLNHSFIYFIPKRKFPNTR